MSFGYPILKEKFQNPTFKLQQPILEKQLSMNMLRNIQGIHAPLRLSMELKAFDNVGRLPFLPSSNLSKDVLLGKDDCIDFCDILYTPNVHEHMNQPHIVLENKYKIL